jgi:hypothetical protein
MLVVVQYNHIQWSHLEANDGTVDLCPALPSIRYQLMNNDYL